MKLTVSCTTHNVTTPVIGRISTRPTPDREATILITRDNAADLAGYAGVLWDGDDPPPVTAPIAHDFRNLEYLRDGDVVSVRPGMVRTLYRRDSPHNSILMTEQCNSYCVMCSQPPRQIDDRGRITEHLALVRLIDPATVALGITGGEPTLFRDHFLQIVDACKRYLPATALHVLTNGRSFYYKDFARRLGAIQHPDLMLGIPLYAATDSLHDYVVQARGAFEETIIGLLHLNASAVPVEIRIVVHRDTVGALRTLAEFIARNLAFASQVAIMGLEPIGFAKAQLDKLWVDPLDYQDELRDAVETLALSGMKVCIYNHQLCITQRSLWPFMVRSISDWKNVYHDECTTCSQQERCGGLFASATTARSRGIRSI